MAILSDRMWERHTNPWSGWTRVLIMPVLAYGLYTHNWWVLVGTAIWAVINPMVFPKSDRIDNWMSKGVIGERIYYANNKKFKRDLPTFLNALNIPVFAAFIYYGWRQELVPLILAGLLTMTLKFWFIDRMARLAEDTHVLKKFSLKPVLETRHFSRLNLKRGRVSTVFLSLCVRNVSAGGTYGCGYLRQCMWCLPTTDLK